MKLRNQNGLIFLCLLLCLLVNTNPLNAQYNTKLGYNAGGIDTVGHRNVMVGAHAGESNNGSGNIFIGHQAGQNIDTSSNLLIITNDTTKNTIYGDLRKQQIAIGTRLLPSDTMYKLAVEGKIIAREFKATQTAAWPDYVFDEKYALFSLDSLQNFLKQNKHLPNVPSAAEVELNGIELANMNAVLLEKIEELTLYLINQHEKLIKQEKSIEEQTIFLRILSQQFEDFKLETRENR